MKKGFLKKAVCFGLSVCTVLSMGSIAFAENDRKIPVLDDMYAADSKLVFDINNQTAVKEEDMVFDIKGLRISEKGEAIAPVRAAAEVLGIDPETISWDEKRNTIYAGNWNTYFTKNYFSPEPVFKYEEREILEAKKKYGVLDENFVVSILARLEPYKGHIYILEAAEILKDMGIPIKVIIAGTGSFEDEIKKLITQKGLENEVLMAGFVNNVRELLSITDVQANASYGTEATSLSLLEGMSMGIPAVVSDFGGNPGVISNGENGFVFPSKDSASLAIDIKKLYDDKELYKNMSQRSKEIFSLKFTAEIYAENIEKVYTDVFEGGRQFGKEQI